MSTVGHSGRQHDCATHRRRAPRRSRLLTFIGEDEDGESRYRVRCLRCKSDCVTAREDALLLGRVKRCWDCNWLASLTPHQRTVLATKRKLDSPNLIPELDRVDVDIEVHEQVLTFGEALGEAA